MRFSLSLLKRGVVSQKQNERGKERIIEYWEKERSAQYPNPPNDCGERVGVFPNVPLVQERHFGYCGKSLVTCVVAAIRYLRRMLL